MADIRCPNCGRDNPDFLDFCQFCQAPLTPESVVHIGEKPTKKNTGELEPILPQWLKDVRQQARDSAEEEAAQTAAQPKVPQNEAPDFLAGLASQVRVDEEEIPDWLANINPPTKPKPSAPSTPEPKVDLLAQFDQGESIPAPQPPGMAAEDELPSWMAADPSPTPERDELSEWFSKASAESGAPASAFRSRQGEEGWMGGVESPAPDSNEAAVPKEQEDLSWLHDLEASSKQSAEPPQPRPDVVWGSGANVPTQAGQGEDLSWLNNLGGAVAPSVKEPEGPSAPQEDLSWLGEFAAAQSPSPQEPAPSRPDDLDWLNQLGKQSVSPFAEPAADQTLPGDELGKPGKPVKKQDTSSPLPTVAPFVPRRTAPLSDIEADSSMPDWLKSVTEESTILPLGADALDQFRDDNPPPPAPDEPFSWTKPLRGIPRLKQEAAPVADQPQPIDQIPPMPVPSESKVPTLGKVPSSLSDQAVDSLFSVEMPDWMSRPEPASGDAPSKQEVIPSAEAAESLSPVELPSWVQAMRPVESVLGDAALPSLDNQPAEKEGPLAGFRGVIPVAPIGSSRRPKAYSLKLQATDEQQSSASLLEQILAVETTPRSSATSSVVTSQRVLRWILTGLIWIVLGAVIALRIPFMPISAALPVEADAASNVIANVPDNASVLVVIDYEPSLAGEMEVVSGPLLDHMVLSHRPQLTFLSTSPNGSALVERLMTETRINQPAPGGLDYRAGEQYFNLGYLPGGSAGVLAFVRSPAAAMPAARVGDLSAYAAVIVLSDHAESSRVWVEQLNALKQTDPALASQPLLVVASAQAGPLLQPYIASGQIAGMVSGLPDAARYEYKNNVPPGTARVYWDAFSLGLLAAVATITLGSLGGFLTQIRERRANAG